MATRSSPDSAFKAAENGLGIRRVDIEGLDVGGEVVASSRDADALEGGLLADAELEEVDATSVAGFKSGVFLNGVGKCGGEAGEEEDVGEEHFDAWVGRKDKDCIEVLGLSERL